MAKTKAEMAALPETPRDVVGDIRVCRYLRFFSGDVAKVWRDGAGESALFQCTLPKTNMDTQNDGLERVTPSKNGNLWYPC